MADRVIEDLLLRLPGPAHRGRYWRDPDSTGLAPDHQVRQSLVVRAERIDAHHDAAASLIHSNHEALGPAFPDPPGRRRPLIVSKMADAGFEDRRRP